MAKKVFSVTSDVVRSHSERFFPSVAVAPKAKAKSRQKPPVPTPGPRRDAYVSGNTATATAFIKEWKPDGSHVLTDVSMGRWVLVYPGHARRSVSWSKRGFQDAAILVIDALWTWHISAGGGQPAWSLAQLHNLALSLDAPEAGSASAAASSSGAP